MAKCDIQVLLDEPDRVYHAGEEIKGHVRVETDGDCKCDGLNIEIEQSTTGRGTHTSKVLEKIELFKGKWVGQSRHQYSFSIPVPEKVRPYHGTLLNVIYRMQARADVPWAIDPKGDAPLNIAYAAQGALSYGWNENLLKRGTPRGCFYVPLLMSLVGAPWLLYCLLTHPTSAGAPTALLGLGTIGVLFFGRKWLAMRRLGSVEVSFRTADSGSQVTDVDEFFVEVRTKSSKPINGIHSALKVYEQVSRGSGSKRQTYTHSLFESSVTLEKSEEGLYRGRVTLPRHGECPPSISVMNNYVMWQLTTHVDIPKCPDWVKKVNLRVRPKKA